ncbi:tyrosine-type recombinase/integrase [Psychroflexus salis]|uniref:Integrase n=1 Tax=Psychroflexus salis TaxID=1526574 RepID=A0A917A0L2_9FLAO|nr:tyrosine-type recombinase/integrase [Psychroflexus salis]GGE21211.1 integrase [Psychroflexus salis]
MDLITSFIDYIESEKKYSKHTILAYQKDVLQFKSFVENVFDETNLADVKYTFIRNWIIYLKEKGLENNSINRKISTLQLFYKHLLKSNVIEVSPLVKHKSLKAGKKEEIPFSVSEIEKVLGLFGDDFASIRDKLIIELLYSTGMRRAELVGLTENSFNQENLQLKILGKRNKERIVPLLPKVVSLIEKYLKLKKNFSVTSVSFFVKDSGEPISDNFVYQVVNKAFANASTKLKKSPHILRHSFATHLLNNGANLAEVKDLLGHTSLASTQVYTHNSIAKLKASHQTAHPRNKT